MSHRAKVTAQPGQSTIHIERLFDFPKAKVFSVVTNPKLIPQWWVGPGYTVTKVEMDVREGGRWCFTQASPDGQHSFQFFGSYHEVSAPDRVVQTFEFSGLPARGHVILEKMELTELSPGQTKLTVIQAFFSVADRDGMLQSGMEAGMENTYQQLEKVLAAN